MLKLTDPALTSFPMIHMAKPGRMELRDEEVQGLRHYLHAGGTLMADDFWGTYEWDNFEAQMKRVMPDGRFVDLNASHPIFHSFFEIDRLDIIPQAYIAGTPIFRGLYEDNDSRKRLQILVNYNTDISQFWEWSGTGLRPIDDTNEAYKLGVNYIVYGLTH